MKILALIIVLAITGFAQDQFDGMEQKIIQSMNNGDCAALESLFNPPMRDAVPEPKVNEILRYFQQQFGKIIKTESSGRSPGARFTASALGCPTAFRTAPETVRKFEICSFVHQGEQHRI